MEGRRQMGSSRNPELPQIECIRNVAAVALRSDFGDLQFGEK